MWEDERANTLDIAKKEAKLEFNEVTSALADPSGRTV
jgi:hypothetical protein